MVGSWDTKKDSILCVSSKSNGPCSFATYHYRPCHAGRRETGAIQYRESRFAQPSSREGPPPTKKSMKPGGNGIEGVEIGKRATKRPPRRR